MDPLHFLVFQHSQRGGGDIRATSSLGGSSPTSSAASYLVRCRSYERRAGASVRRTTPNLIQAASSEVSLVAGCPSQANLIRVVKPWHASTTGDVARKLSSLPPPFATDGLSSLRMANGMIAFRNRIVARTDNLGVVTVL